MKTQVLILLTATGLTAGLGAQNAASPAGSSTLTFQQAGDAQVSSPLQTPCQRSGLVPSADLNWLPGLTHKMEESEPAEPNAALLEKIREEVFKKKQNNRFAALNSTPASTLAVTPVVGVHYGANKNNGWSPLDNNVAISNKGLVVSVANDTFEVDDSTGTRLYYNTLNTFINDNTIPNACDPVIVYDKGADRFIFYCQEVTSTSGAVNHMMVFFSKTNNPATGGWNYFKFSGDPLGTGSMADYPKIAVSDKDVFISSNLFVSGSFSQSIVLQIGKSAGYAGGTLVSKVWSAMAGSPFTVLPVGDGQGNSYGPGCWMVAASSSGSSNIDLYQITTDVSSSPTMNHYAVATTAYTPAGASQQLNSSATLSITDCRALSGFYLNGLIHFVHSTADAQGNTAINYNRLDPVAKTNTSKLLSVNATDYGYPSVASYTASGVTGDNSVMIGFAEANSTILPRMCAVSCDNGMNFGTVTIVKPSDSYVGSSGAQRWGDYSGMCRKHNSPQACVWMSGSYGNTSNRWDAYVAQIYDAGFATTVTEHKNVSNLKAYPNPVIDLFTIDFTANEDTDASIVLYDLQGRLVKSLYQGYCHQGENNFSFNKSNLSPGTYFLVIRSASNTNLVHEKIVIAD
jgi:hypothetical protein